MSKLTNTNYPARVIDKKLGQSDSGSEFIALLFEVTEGECKGQKASGRLFFTEKTIERTLESLEYCGWNGYSIAELDGLGSKEVEIVLDYEEYEGKQYLRVKWINKPRGAQVKRELDRGGVLALDERIKGAMIARRQSREEDGPPF